MGRKDCAPPRYGEEKVGSAHPTKSPGDTNVLEHGEDVDRDEEKDPELPSDENELTPTRRDVVRRGVKLAFLAPVISTFFAHEAYAANYSCYPQGHACHNTGDFEPCCGTLVCNGNPGTCQP